jgi:hypothetical protein
MKLQDIIRFRDFMEAKTITTLHAEKLPDPHATNPSSLTSLDPGR